MVNIDFAPKHPTDFLISDFGSFGNSQPRAMNTSLIIDPETRTVTVRTRPWDNPVPDRDEWYKRVVVIFIPPSVDAVELKNIISTPEDDTCRLIEIICDGFCTKPNMSGNMVGHYSPQASDAIDKLTNWIEERAPKLQGDNAGLWHAVDYLYGTSNEELLKLGNTFEEVATVITNDALSENVILVGLEEHLEDRLPILFGVP